MDVQALKIAIAEIEVAEAELKAAQAKYDHAAAKVRTFADAFGYTPAAMAYMLSGVFEATLGGVIGLIVFAAVRGDVWRDLALWACGIAVAEGLMQTGCRL